ncbi:MAG: radical SAM protein [Candidatus Eisenbacteria bacterium]
MITAGSAAKLGVCEIYASILGESTYAGWPGVIVRLAGCPLRCTWCDTPQAQQRGEEVPIGEILQRATSFGFRLVLLTGGEPLAQPGSRHLVTELLKLGYQVVIETGGGVSIQGVDPRACIVLDIKCPGSGMHDRQVWENLEGLKPEDELKFVLASRSDYEWARDFLRQSGLAERHVIHFSPVQSDDDASGLTARALAEWIIADRLPVRLNLQLHVCIWGRGQRGV